QARSVAGWRSSGTVLVIDDDPTVALVTRRALKLFGFTVLMANDGASGVEIVRERSREIACVLLDMTMPGMSGRETLVAIHEVDQTIPVIVMSGFAREEVDSHFRQ